MLATRCRIERKEPVHAYDDPRHEPPYPPPGRDFANDRFADHTFELANDGFRITVTAHATDETWVKTIGALIDSLATPNQKP